MKPSEKARITRVNNKTARQAKDAEKKAIKDVVRNSLLAVAGNKEATPAERLEASKLLLKLI